MHPAEKPHPATTFDELCVNTIRCLAIDMVQKANSGHPGAPLGAAAMAYVLWDRFLKHNPADPFWIDRDRFILSAGHAASATRDTREPIAPSARRDIRILAEVCAS